MSKTYRYNIVCNVHNNGALAENYKYTFESIRKLPTSGENTIVEIFESVSRNNYRDKHMALTVDSRISKVCEVECENLITPSIPTIAKRPKGRSI